MNDNGKLNVGTRLVTAGRQHGESAVSVNMPVHRASTFLFDTLEDFEEASKTPFDGPFYGRVGTPTVFAFEQAVAELEGGYRTIAQASGIAAITSSLLAFLDTGDHLLLVDTTYENVRRFCQRILERMGIETTFYAPDLNERIVDLIRPNTRMIYMESPGTGTFEMQDVPAIAKMARERGIVTAIDNTWATPYFFKPLEHGVDISLQAGTKYFGGHSDIMLGAVTMTEDCYDAVRRATQDLGGCAGSEEANLGLRGLRTLEVRLRRHEQSALEIAQWLEERPEVVSVLHPALPSFPGHEIWKRDYTGSTGLFTIELGSFTPDSVRTMINGLNLFKVGFSWGGYESQVLPMYPEKTRKVAKRPGTGALVRLHIGLETVSDLKDDLEQGLSRLISAS